MCADSIASRTLARALRYFASKTKKRFAEGESKEIEENKSNGLIGRIVLFLVRFADLKAYSVQGRTLSTSRMQHSGPEWAHRNVRICFPGQSNAWALVYPLQNASALYFDFMYIHKEPPQEVLSALLRKYSQCSVIDWSPGRLACIEAQGVMLRRSLKLSGI